MEEHLCALGRAMPTFGFECLFMPRVEYPPAFAQRLRDAGVRIVEEPAVLVREGADPALQRWTPALGRLLRREHVDIYHFHSNLLGNEYWSALAARVAGVRALVCSYHSPIGRESTQRRLAMRMIHQALGVYAIAVSSVVRDQVATCYKPRSGRLLQIPSSVEDVAPGGARPQAGAHSQLTIGFVGRLSHEKGVDILLSALAQVADRGRYRVVLIGDGHERAALERQTRDLGLDGVVEFRGMLLNASAYLSEFDVVVIPSRLEGFGMIGAEACAASRPIIASRVGGLLDIVVDGENGWFVPPDDPAALALALERAAAEPATLQRMGEAGRRRYEAYWRVETMAARIAQVYEAALGRPGSGSALA
jgi:glycosyltransferase involved in cell wall biosynthesis